MAGSPPAETDANAMKALVYTNTNEVTYRDEPDPVRGDGEVVLDIDAVGICGSDLHAYHGRDPRRSPPLILGHEVSGTIVEGNADLAILEQSEPATWTVVDFKTDFEIEGKLEEYREQVALYARAISRATGLGVKGILLRL